LSRVTTVSFVFFSVLVTFAIFLAFSRSYISINGSNDIVICSSGADAGFTRKIDLTANRENI
jgi:hypothetical protein